MSTMHGPRKDKKSREENYQMFFKCAIALGILITLSVIAQIATGGLGLTRTCPQPCAVPPACSWRRCCACP